MTTATIPDSQPRSLLDHLADGPKTVEQLAGVMHGTDWRVWNRIVFASQQGWVTCDAKTAAEFEDWLNVFWWLTPKGEAQHANDLRLAAEPYYSESEEGDWL